MQVTIHKAETNPSKLVERVETGEEAIIMRDKTPVAKIVPINPFPQGRKFGALKGEFEVTDAFFEPLPPDELKGWLEED
jgi:antitoxin (DNA-binding transcriptional repressor) of toxin-antitoxin stability system